MRNTLALPMDRRAAMASPVSPSPLRRSTSPALARAVAFLPLYLPSALAFALPERWVYIANDGWEAIYYVHITHICDTG